MKPKVYYELGRFFYYHKIPVPKIEFWDQKSGALIIEDLGDIKLSELKNPFLYYYKVIEILIKLQKLVPFFPVDKTLDASFYNFNFLWERKINYLKNYKNLKLNFFIIDEIFNWAKEKSQFID